MEIRFTGTDKRMAMKRDKLLFDEAHLRYLIRTMTPRTRFYRVLKEELTQLGRWKNRPRGNGGSNLFHRKDE